MTFTPNYSVVLPTLGRIEPVIELVNCLNKQTILPDQIIIIDQNNEPLDFNFKLADSIEFIHIHVPWKGLSKARNYGLNLVSSEHVLFADDDSTIPEDTFKIALEKIQAFNLDALAIRLQDPDSNETMLNYPKESCKTHFNNIHNTTCEGATIWRTEALKQLQGYDEALGLGRYHSSEEGADIIYRALKSNMQIAYIADIFVFHPSNRDAPA